MAPFVLCRDFYMAEMQPPSFATLALLDEYITDYSTHERGNQTVTKRRHRTQIKSSAIRQKTMRNVNKHGELRCFICLRVCRSSASSRPRHLLLLSSTSLRLRLWRTRVYDDSTCPRLLPSLWPRFRFLPASVLPVVYCTLPTAQEAVPFRRMGTD